MSSNASSIKAKIIGFLDSIKDTANSWLSKLDLNSNKIVEIVSFFGIGLFSGFLLKKYFRYFLILVLILFLGIFFLDYLSIVNINWIKLKSYFGFSAADNLESVVNFFINWIKVNWIVSASGFIGFLVGYKVG